MIGWLKCRLGLHTRSRRDARKSSVGYVSVCERCSVSMVRIGDKKWRVLNEVETRN